MTARSPGAGFAPRRLPAPATPAGATIVAAWLCLAALAVSSGAGTLASWTEWVPSRDNTMSAGRLTLEVGGPDVFAPHALDRILPGSAAEPVDVVVRNAGDVHGDVTLRVSGLGPSGSAARALRVAVRRFDGTSAFDGPLSAMGAADLGHLDPGPSGAGVARIVYSLPETAGNESQSLPIDFQLSLHIEQTR